MGYSPTISGWVGRTEPHARHGLRLDVGGEVSVHGTLVRISLYLDCRPFEIMLATERALPSVPTLSYSSAQPTLPTAAHVYDSLSVVRGVRQGGHSRKISADVVGRSLLPRVRGSFVRHCTSDDLHPQ